MKKLLLLLSVLTTLANVSFASFPVKGTTHSIEVEIHNLNESTRRDITWIYSLASFLLGILGWLFVFILIGGAMGGSPDSVLDRFFIFYIISSVGAVFLGGMSVIKKSKGYILGILGAVLGVLALSLIIFSR
tara:strand:- start:61 stop:456 length:396 start_codon:yes stop_codon:yes gene_type:complete